ncbi:MAG: hypothetical protein MMC23_009969, partial [Stictis urceolatum]|nr:hypothetical protein [Stictis urceolata]
CGLTADERAFKIAEELSGLFDSRMNFSNPTKTDAERSGQSISEAPASVLGYSSSQHYYPPPAQLASKNIMEGSLDDYRDIRQILANYSVEWSSLLSYQLDLFRQADLDQRQRLAELWRVSSMKPTSPYEPTREVRGEAVSVGAEAGLLAGASCELNNLHDASGGFKDNHGILSNDDMDSAVGNVSQSEPYVTAGYAALSERAYTEHQSYPAKEYHQAFDPAFSGREWWRDFVAKQPMENQYDMLDQMNQVHPPAQMKNEDEDML